MCLPLYTFESDASIMQAIMVGHLRATDRQQPQSGQAVGARTLRFHVEKSLHFATGAASLKIALELPHGQWLALLGPSGAGKTSLLRILAGLTEPESGWLQAGTHTWFDASQKFSLPTRHRRIGFVFQDQALFPHMTALKNLLFALPRGGDAALADELLDLVGLRALSGRYPAQLSGGQQQRLALARALATQPSLLLLDEPLSSLDAELRGEMQELLLEIRRRSLVDYALLVTHDADEARRLAHRVVRLERGQVVTDALSGSEDFR